MTKAIRWSVAAVTTSIALVALGAGSDAEAGSLSSLVSGLYGGNGITLDPAIVGHVAHFQASSVEALDNLGSLISADIGNYSATSSVAAITFDIQSGVPVRIKGSLGPIIGDRATTVGQGRINLSASISYINYSTLNGQNLNSLTLDLHHNEVPGNPSYVNDIIRLHLNLSLSEELVSLQAIYGVTDNLDVGVILPVERIEGNVFSHAEIIDRGGEGIHQFGGTASPDSSNSGEATGIGDMILHAKWRVTPARDRFSAALVAETTLSTGDPNDLLGTGSYSFYGGGIASAALGRFNPHLDFGYEQFFSHEGVNGYKRSNARLVAGADLEVNERLAFSTDFLGRWRADGTTFYDLAIGGKWEVKSGIPIFLNFIFPANRNVGLRPDVVVMGGVETTF
jgi:hypothetical protein